MKTLSKHITIFRRQYAISDGLMFTIASPQMGFFGKYAFSFCVYSWPRFYLFEGSHIIRRLFIHMLSRHLTYDTRRQKYGLRHTERRFVTRAERTTFRASTFVKYSPFYTIVFACFRKCEYLHSSTMLSEKTKPKWEWYIYVRSLHWDQMYVCLNETLCIFTERAVNSNPHGEGNILPDGCIFRIFFQKYFYGVW